jgi:tetratricopeptide (TPR) repeat protein
MPPILLWILAGLFIMSIFAYRLSVSGILESYEYIGWIYFGVYIAIYIPFVAAWYQATGEVKGWEIFYIILLGALILPLGHLGAELLKIAVMPDLSKGLKLLKVHTAAERKVAEDDLPGAIEEYEKVLAKNSSDIAARLRMADLCNEAKQYEKAAAAYEILVKKPQGLGVDQHCSVLTRLSEIYARDLGEYEKARGTVQVIIDKYPDTDYAKFAKDRLSNL